MNNNAIITTTLEDLLNIMDARAYISLFVKEDDVDKCTGPTIRVYELLTDSEKMSKWGAYRVISLSTFNNVAGVLIKEA